MGLLYTMVKKNIKRFAITRRPKVLLPGELKKLLMVKTTRDQAKLIYIRNLKLLEWLEKHEQPNGEYHSFTIKYGCPHCQKIDMDNDSDCNDCAWNSYPHPANTTAICFRAEFAGYTLDDMEDAQQIILIFDRDHAMIQITAVPLLPAKMVDSSIDYYLDHYEDDYEMTHKFLEGHLEWTIAVIEKSKKE